MNLFIHIRMSKTLPPIPPNFGKKDPYPPKQNQQTKQNQQKQKKKGKIIIKERALMMNILIKK